MQDEIAFGHDLMSQGDLAQADSHFNALLLRDPENHEIHRARITIAQRGNDRRITSARLKKFLNIAPNEIFERALFALLNALQSLPDARCELDVLLGLARTQGLDARSATPLVKLIHFAATPNAWNDQLRAVRSLLDHKVSQDLQNTFAEQALQAGIALTLQNHGAFVDDVARLSDVGVQGRFKQQLRGLTCVRDKITSPKYPDFDAPKVFEIGLSRTGTSSLHAGLRQLGYHSVHWLNPISHDLIQSKDFLLFDAFSDICVSHQFEWLYHTYPNSKFIYTTRDVQSWRISLQSHYERMHADGALQSLRTAAYKSRFRNAGGEMDNNLYARHDSWENAYRAFDTRVRSFFDGPRSDRFLELAVVKGEGWNTLCPFLGHPTPDKAFPYLNAKVVKRKPE
jgi:hypothetical protein